MDLVFSRPSSLKEIYEQKEIVTFLQNVIADPMNSPHYFLFSGHLGCGKTSIVKAFAKDFLKDNFKKGYTEIDSSNRKILEDFSTLKHVLFSPASSEWKVVLFDEAHKLESVQTDLLKTLEDFYGKIFIFFCTTEPDILAATLRSRLFDFEVHAFSRPQLVDFAKKRLLDIKKNISDQTLAMAAIISNKSIREMLKNVTLILQEGEKLFIEVHCVKFNTLKDYLFNPDILTENIINILKNIPVPFVKLYLLEIFHSTLKNMIPPYTPKTLYSLLTQYLQLQTYVREPGDFYLFLDLFRRKSIIPILLSKETYEQK